MATFEVIVRLPSDKGVAIGGLTPDSTVATIKLKLYDAIGTLPSMCTLTFNKMPLANNAALSMYKIGKESVLALTEASAPLVLVEDAAAAGGCKAMPLKEGATAATLAAWVAANMGVPEAKQRLTLGGKPAEAGQALAADDVYTLEAQ